MTNATRGEMIQFQHYDVIEAQRILTRYKDEDTPNPRGYRGVVSSCIGNPGCRGDDGRSGRGNWSHSVADSILSRSSMRFTGNDR